MITALLRNVWELRGKSYVSTEGHRLLKFHQWINVPDFGVN